MVWRYLEGHSPPTGQGRPVPYPEKRAYRAQSYSTVQTVPSFLLFRRLLLSVGPPTAIPICTTNASCWPSRHSGSSVSFYSSADQKLSHVRFHNGNTRCQRNNERHPFIRGVVNYMCPLTVSRSSGFCCRILPTHSSSFLEGRQRALGVSRRNCRRGAHAHFQSVLVRRARG